MPLSVADLRRYAIARSLFRPTKLKRAIEKLGFVQADPIRAPARAQDLTLRHRVTGYRAGDLERKYESLGIEEDHFINYGFVSRQLFALMHPRSTMSYWPAAKRRKVQALLDFVRARGTVHPREVDAHFAHGRVTNYWGGSSSATTHLLEAMHYRSLLRIARRDTGIKIYAPHEHDTGPIDAVTRDATLDALVDVVVGKYAPLPASSFNFVLMRLRYAVPQWERALPQALRRAKARLAHASVDGIEWYWPAGERAEKRETDAAVRLLAPFDPIVWDRRRFERLWGWAYRFEAYTPVKKRVRGYYALPMLWRDRVIGWGNLSVKNGALDADFGYVEKPARGDRVFARELDAEMDRMREFLKL